MSTVHRKTTTFSTNFDFMTTAQKNVVFIVTKQGNFYIFVRRSDKKSTCMINRQRQSKITQKGSEMSRFFRFVIVKKNRFLEEAPKCSPPSCYRYTVLGNDVQSPIYLDESARLAPLSKLPCSP